MRAYLPLLMVITVGFLNLELLYIKIQVLIYFEK